MMRATLVPTISSGLALPAAAGDLDLIVGLRSVIAAAIQDAGYNCPDMKRIVDLRPDERAVSSSHLRAGRAGQVLGRPPAPRHRLRRG